MKIADIIAENDADEPTDAGAQLRLPFDDGPSHEFLSCLAIYTGGDFNYHHGQDNAAFQRVAKCFDAEMPVLDKSYKVWRGMRFNSWDEFHYSEWDYLGGEPLTITGYTSTSMEYRIAKQAAMIDLTLEYNTDVTMFEGPAIIFEIQTMPGARGIKVPDYAHYYDDFVFTDTNGRERSHMPELLDEHEILLNRGAQFEVVDYNDVRGRMEESDYAEVRLRQIA